MDDEIDLLALWRTLLKYKRMILIAPLLVALLAAGISMTLPNIYRGEIIIVPAAGDDKKGGLGAALGNLGGLAALAGVSVGGGSSNEENLAVLQSRDFLWQFVQDKKLLPLLFDEKWDEKAKNWKEADPKKQPSQLDVHRLFKDNILKVESDKKSGLITVAIEWKDAKLSSEWTNLIIEYLNQYLAERAISRSESNLKYLNEALMNTQVEEVRNVLFNLIADDTKKVMLASVQKDFAFKVIDPAIEPDKKIKPKRALIVILAALVAGFLAVIYAFIREALSKRRAQEMAQ
jgi:uncharacterized protein involved in exopolysaccharide biosynthesis